MSLRTWHKLPLRHCVAGALVLIGLLLQLFRLGGFPVPLSLVSCAFWLAVGLLWFDLEQRNRRQAGVLAGAGLAFLTAAWLGYGAKINWLKLLDGNTYVVAMLVGVSFIGLIGNGKDCSVPSGSTITGRYGATSIWLSVHLLGAILNLSSVLLVGDRLRRHGEIVIPQILALNRGLSSAALWSPFFASMGVVLILAPEMNFALILAFSLPLALLSGVLSVYDLSRRFGLDKVVGYSLSYKSLMVPVSLAILVIIFKYSLYPGATIISIITFLLPVVAIVYNLTQGPYFLLRRLRSHTVNRLPSMRGEISLFLCAGLFAQGVSTFITAVTDSEWTVFAYFGVLQAVTSFLAIVASAMVGLHPIVGVSVLASVLDLEGSRQTLFAFVALCSWAVGTSISPLSGINLSLQGRYGVSGSIIMRHNLFYAGVMAGLVIVSVFLLDAVL